jgi:PIN domain nuclease of toxin-antitoxin system
MDILLDTHVFIWFIEDNKSLSKNLKKDIENPANSIYVSMASHWEMAIKYSLGKLNFKLKLPKVFDQIIENGFNIMSISSIHILKSSELTFHHRDPFDRLIIAQSIVEDMHIITADDIFEKYKIKRIWK